jgi:hypothetical protein
MPTANIAVATTKNGKIVEISGDANNPTRRNGGQNANPPRVGVGRVCHRSLLGIATEPHRVANRLTTGTLMIVRRKAALRILTIVALFHAAFISS